MRAIRLLVVLLVVLVSSSVGAAGKAKSPYLDHSKKLQLLAWSKDGTSLAVRRETVQWHESKTGGPEPVAPVPLERSIIDIIVWRCGANMKSTKRFEISSEKDQSPASRGKNWQQAERWLEKAGYTFVLGAKAAPIKNDLMKTFDWPDHLPFPLPRALLPAWMESLELIVGPGENTPEGESRQFVGMVGRMRGDPNEWQNYEIFLHADNALPDLANGTTCTVEYGPKAACFVLTCTGLGAYTSVNTTQQSFRTEALKKHLPPSEWSSHSEQ